MAHNMNTYAYTQLVLRPWGAIVSGGADGDPPPADGAAGAPPAGDGAAGAPPAADGDALGAPGLAALQAERTARATAERERKALQIELDTIKAANLTETERAIEAAKKAGRDEAMAVANKRLVAAEVKAAATGKLIDPSLADRLLDTSTFVVDDSGNVDTKAITSAIDALIVEKPYLAATAGKPGPPGRGDGGPQGTPPAGQLGQEDLDRMTREGKHEEIQKARIDGRFNTLMGA